MRLNEFPCPLLNRADKGVSGDHWFLGAIDQNFPFKKRPANLATFKGLGPCFLKPPVRDFVDVIDKSVAKDFAAPDFICICTDVA